MSVRPQGRGGGGAASPRKMHTSMLNTVISFRLLAGAVPVGYQRSVGNDSTSSFAFFATRAKARAFWTSAVAMAA